jgi:hypothetical protein
MSSAAASIARITASGAAMRRTPMFLPLLVKVDSLWRRIITGVAFTAPFPDNRPRALIRDLRDRQLGSIG